MPFGHPGQGKLKSALPHITPLYVLSWSPPKYSSQGGWFPKTRFTVFAKRTHRHIKRIHYKKKALAWLSKIWNWILKTVGWVQQIGVELSFLDRSLQRRATANLLTTLCPTHLSPQQEKLNQPGISCCFSPTPRAPLSAPAAAPIESVWRKSPAS